MIKNISKKLFRYVRIIIIIFVIFVVDSSSSSILTKVENDNFNKNVDLTTMALKVDKLIEDDLYYPINSLTGQLTGYAHDCPLCNGTLACAYKYDIRDRKDFYPDKEYGNVKIVASSKKLPCGTIIRFKKKNLSDDPIIAIVLDRGVPGNNLDLLVPTEEYAIKHVGRSTITYDILRTGW